MEFPGILPSSLFLVKIFYSGSIFLAYGVHKAMKSEALSTEKMTSSTNKGVQELIRFLPFCATDSACIPLGFCQVEIFSSQYYKTVWRFAIPVGIKKLARVFDTSIDL